MQALACTGVDVRFGVVQALQNVDLSFEQGKIHALLGQNGAGKSTLARVLSGLIRPDAGELTLLGRPIQAGDPGFLRDAGLDIVHQRFSLPPTFTVAEALELASARKLSGAVFRAKNLNAAWGARLRDSGIDVDPAATLSKIPVETIQALEILRALANDAKVLILDEPTALLSPTAIDTLFERLRALRATGVTVIVILHKLKEVTALSDTVSILRDGTVVLPPTPTQSVTEAQMSDLMIGDVAKNEPALTHSDRAVTPNETILALRNVSSARLDAEPGLVDVDLDLRAGEILGVAGIEGNGQRALATVLAGLNNVTEGVIELKSNDITQLDSAKRRDLGLRVVPFDRMTDGSGLELSLWENTCVWQPSVYRNGRFGLVSTGKMQEVTKAALSNAGVVFSNVNQEAGGLSGGNLQRVILAREFDGPVQVVLAAQPTRGLDFRATDFVWSQLRRLRNAGAGILLISSDLDELFAICDRLAVFRAGRLSPALHRPFDLRQVGDAIVGAAR